MGVAYKRGWLGLPLPGLLGLLGLLALLVVAGLWLASAPSRPDGAALDERSVSLEEDTAYAQGVRSMPLPTFADITESGARKLAFFKFIRTLVTLENHAILRNRLFVKAQQADIALNRSLGDARQQRLEALLDRYALDSADIDPQTLQDLLRRMDVIPPSLAMAQAANESAWGTSRFAVEGNNLFGQWCVRPGCGIKPAQRAANATHEVRRFKYPFESVAAYIHNLNTHAAYRELRGLRAGMRDAGQPITGMELAPGLIDYSERGTVYVAAIQNLITSNRLTRADLAKPAKPAKPSTNAQ